MYACLYVEGNQALLIECARHFSPRFEEPTLNTVLIDLRGLGLLYESPAAIAEAILYRAGIPLNLALAADPDTAIFAARGFRGLTIVPAGQEATVLAALPLNLLPGSPETAGILDAWGIRTFGEFGALPPLGVAARLGKEGTYLQNLVRGNGRRELRPIEAPLVFEEEFELEYPVELLEPLSFLLARLLNDLCSRLRSRALSADEIRLKLKLENAPLHGCTLRLPLPMRDAKVFLKLLQLELDARPPVAPVLKIWLELKPVKPRTEQHNLFVAMAPEPAKLEITLAKLSNLLGAENVGTPQVLNTHRPDAFIMNRFRVVNRVGERTLPSQSALALRRYRPTKHVQVITRDERPVHIATLDFQGKVVAAAGPWQTSGDWWRPDPWDHDEWDIALSSGLLYRICKDRRTNLWAIEGFYD